MNKISVRILIVLFLFFVTMGLVSAQYVRVYDTSAMLRRYLRKSDTSSMLAKYLRKSDTSSMLTRYLRKTDTTVMLSRYLRKSDSSSMLAGYLRKTDTTFMLSRYLRETDSSSMLQNYLRKTDTSSMLGRYLRKTDTSALLSGYGRNGQVMKYSDTALMLSGYQQKYTGVLYTDTSLMLEGYAKKGLIPDVSIKLNVADTINMLSGYGRKNQIVHYTDTASILDGYVRKVNLPNLSTVVPYVGASADLNMGNKSIQVGLGKWFANTGLGGSDLSIGTEMNQMMTPNGSSLNISAKLYPIIAFWREGHIPAGSIASAPSGRGAIATIAVTGDLSASEANMYDLGGIASGSYRWRNVYAAGGDYSGNVLASSFVKSGGMASQLLAADGSVATAGNNISILDGVISVNGLSAVAKSGNYNDLTNKPTLSNYLPLTGGSLTGTLFGTTGIFSGNLTVQKLTVTQKGWSDFVFNKDYPLKPLSEVAAFIKQNHHLPDVPSAREVAEKGISVGDNQALLLQKIEELTLYLLQQNQKIASLEQKIQQLKRK